MKKLSTLLIIGLCLLGLVVVGAILVGFVYICFASFLSRILFGRHG